MTNFLKQTVFSLKGRTRSRIIILLTVLLSISFTEIKAQAQVKASIIFNGEQLNTAFRMLQEKTNVPGLSVGSEYHLQSVCGYLIFPRIF